MRAQKKFLGGLLLAALFLLGLQPKAYAYLDPGSGSFFIQMLLAALVGLSFTIKTFWKKIKEFLIKLFSGGKGPEKKQ